MRSYRFAPKNALLCLPVHVPLAENTSGECRIDGHDVRVWTGVGFPNFRHSPKVREGAA